MSVKNRYSQDRKLIILSIFPPSLLLPDSLVTSSLLQCSQWTDSQPSGWLLTAWSLSWCVAWLGQAGSGQYNQHHHIIT